jgi:hypothetical protein
MFNKHGRAVSSLWRHGVSQLKGPALLDLCHNKLQQVVVFDMLLILVYPTNIFKSIFFPGNRLKVLNSQGEI